MKEKVIFRNGEKVYLRPVCKEDVSKLHVHINDEEVTRYLLVRHPMSLEMEEEWFDGIKKKMETDITLAVVEHKSDELVGVISLHKINHLNGTATFGITLRKYFWRKGYATEASILLFNYAFKDLNLRKINSSVFEGN
ncbi:MAG: GNAT family N-acetyltransferase, partial [Patescibacteria group bacterium]